MNWNRLSLKALLACALLTPSLKAGITVYNSAADYHALGTSSQSSNFDSFSSGALAIGADYTVGDLRFTNPANMLLAPDLMAMTVRSVLTAYDYSAVSASITGMHDLLAFEVGRVAGKDMMDAGYYYGLSPNLFGTIHTNLTDYSLMLPGVPYASDSLRFFGFSVDGKGEYITGFSFRAPEYFGSAVGVTALELGESPALVPETGRSLALLCLGLTVLAAFSRRLLLRH